MKTWNLVRPGISIMGSDMFSPNVPFYPNHFTKPKVGDKVYVILQNEEEFAIDSDTITYVSNFYDEMAHQHEYRRKVFAGEEPWPVDDYGVRWVFNNPLPPLGKPEEYLIDFWIDKYNNGHGNDFGETLYQTFEEAKSVLVQYFTGHYEDYLEVLNATEEELKPD